MAKPYLFLGLIAAIALTAGCNARSQQRLASKSPSQNSGRVKFAPNPDALPRATGIQLTSGGAHEPLAITRENFEEIVLNSPVPVLIDCWAPWCGPCRAMGPVVDSLAEEYEGRVIVAKMDIESCPEIARRYGVTNIPAFLYFRNGEVVDRVVGAVPKSSLERKLKSVSAPVQTVSREATR